jgi:hypothetical protein
MTSPRLLGLPLVALLSTGCPVVARLSGTATVDLSRATLRRMEVSLRKADQTLCPREQTQLAIFMTALMEGAKEPQTFETYVGRGAVNKNDRLDFASFGFEPQLAKVDSEGWIAPIEALPATAGHEISVRVTYNPSPTVYSSVYKWKPDYYCITAAGIAGQDGLPGGPGKEGNPGKVGDGGGVMSSGGDGQDGTLGAVGGEGAPGSVGPKVRAVVTYVKTPFYDKLVGIRLTGGINDFVMVHPGRSFALHANGGKGGPGGPGGKGGAGGNGAAGNPGGHGGNGARGGTGGRGGAGGAGGTIELVYDARFPELAQVLTLDVSGGHGGAGGTGGGGGAGGAGGKGIAPQNSPSTAPDGAKGRLADDGAPGAPGMLGGNGTTSVHAGPIGDAFAGLADITVVAGGGAPATKR